LIKENQYRLLGDVRVSPIGLGTVKFGRNTDVKYPKRFEIPDDIQLSTLLSHASELGINLIDTAPAYGNAEERLGELLQAQRNNWFIATKVGEYYKDGQSHYDFTQRAITESIENSLKNLKTDYLDLVSIHSNGDDESIIDETDVIMTLQTLKSAGKIGSIAMSTKTLIGGLKALEVVDVIMVELNEANQSQIQVIEKAASLGKGVLIKKALSSGHAVKPAKAIKFAVDFPGVSSVILGTINPTHLRENILALWP